MKTCLLITTFNRGSLLRESFHRLLSGGFTVPDEVLVIDDGGNDDTEQVCAAMADFLPVRYVYHHNPGQSLCAEARNVGLKLTDADAIITCEPECYFESDVIQQMLEAHERYPDSVINAGMVHKLNERGEKADALVGWSATHCAFYMRQWLLDIGGWDESFPDPWGWDDTDLLTRLRLSGHGALNAVSIVVVHQFHPSTAVNQDANEAHFFGKRLEESDEHIVANKGVEWGRLEPKP